MIERVLIRGFRILRNFIWEPEEDINIIVGDNASGKSTILDAIELAMCCRLGGRRAAEEINPHWFNQDDVQVFYQSLEDGRDALAPPSILIELYFKSEPGDVARMQGVNNEMKEDRPGISLSICLDEDLREEFFETVRSDSREHHLIPVEYYRIYWKAFEGRSISRSPNGIACFRIDAAPGNSAKAIDYYARATLEANLRDEDRRRISSQYRSLKQEIDEQVLSGILDTEGEDGIADGIGFQMDQSSKSDWRNSVTIEKEGIPLTLAGRGMQVEAKTRLALKKAASKKVLLMEEPENHLSHTSLTRLMGLIESHLSERQLFITTHNAFVLNRLGLDRLALIHDGRSPIGIDELREDTADYFRKQSGIDTLRIVLASIVVLVEGPSDEMIFNWAYEKEHAHEPREDGIDVISYGVRGKRALELAKALGKKRVAVLRDNDGKEPGKWLADASDYLEKGKRELFVGEDVSLRTLEPQMVGANGDNLIQLASAIGYNNEDVSGEALVNYMVSRKTEWAWELVSKDLEETRGINAPQYFLDAIRFVHPQQ